jgi:hypothetical protein
MAERASTLVRPSPFQAVAKGTEASFVCFGGNRRVQMHSRPNRLLHGRTITDAIHIAGRKLGICGRRSDPPRSRPTIAMTLMAEGVDIALAVDQHLPRSPRPRGIGSRCRGFSVRSMKCTNGPRHECVECPCNPRQPVGTRLSPMSQVRSVTYVSGLDNLSDGGAGGIRTLDRPLQAYNGLANRRLQPLGHSSMSADMPDAGPSRKRQIQITPRSFRGVAIRLAFSDGRADSVARSRLAGLCSQGALAADRLADAGAM